MKNAVLFLLTLGASTALGFMALTYFTAPQDLDDDFLDARIKIHLAAIKNDLNHGKKSPAQP